MKFKPPMTVDELAEKVPWSDAPVWRGCDVGQGWVELISRLIDDMNETDCAYAVDQVKEKFGGLRFYYHAIEHGGDCDGFNDWNACPLAQLVTRAEGESYKICEQCGGKAEAQDEGDARLGRWGTYCEHCR